MIHESPRQLSTNVLLRLLTRDDPKQTAAAETFVSQGGWGSHLVLVETVWVLDSVFALTAALARYRRHSKVGFSDCMVREVANKAGHVPVGTFDRAFGKLDDMELP